MNFNSTIIMLRSITCINWDASSNQPYIITNKNKLIGRVMPLYLSVFDSSAVMVVMVSTSFLLLSDPNLAIHVLTNFICSLMEYI